MLFSVLSALLASQQDAEDSSGGANHHDNPQPHIRAVASLGRSFSARLSGSLGDIALFTANVAGSIILIVVCMTFSLASRTTGVACGIAIMVIYVSCCFASSAADITIGITCVVIHMLPYFTSCCTNVAICIAVVIVDVVSDFALCFTLIASVVAIIVVLMLAGLGRLLGNITLSAADIAVGVVHVVVNMLSGSSLSTTNIAVCITIVLVGVLTCSMYSLSVAVTTLRAGILSFAGLTAGGRLGFLRSILMTGHIAGFAANVTIGITQVVILVCAGSLHDFVIAMTTFAACVNLGTIFATSGLFGYLACVCMLRNFALSFANVAVLVASIVIHMVLNLTCFATFITCSIAIMVVDMVGGSTGFATDITVCIAVVLILMLSRGAGSAADVAISVTCILVYMVSYFTLLCTTITFCITCVIIGMLASGLTELIVLFGTTFGALSPTVTSFSARRSQFLNGLIVVLALFVLAAQQALTLVVGMLLGQRQLYFGQYFVTNLTTSLFITMLYAGRVHTVDICFAVFTSGFANFVILLSAANGAFCPYIAGLLTGRFQLLNHDIIVLAEFLGATQQTCIVVIYVFFGQRQGFLGEQLVTSLAEGLLITLLNTGGFVNTYVSFLVQLNFASFAADTTVTVACICIIMLTVNSQSSLGCCKLMLSILKADDCKLVYTNFAGERSIQRNRLNIVLLLHLLNSILHSLFQLAVIRGQLLRNLGHICGLHAFQLSEQLIDSGAGSQSTGVQDVRNNNVHVAIFIYDNEDSVHTSLVVNQHFVLVAVILDSIIFGVELGVNGLDD